MAYTVIAQEAIVVVVNENNPLREPTLYQLRNVLNGQTKTRDELGSAAGDITVISREDGSATRAVFEELVMYGHQMTLTALVMPGSDAVRSYLATHEGAIGYLSFGYLGSGITTIAIDDARPERQMVEDGSYWITRPFLLVSRSDPEPETANFMEFARSPAGQAIVRRTCGGARSGTRR